MNPWRRFLYWLARRELREERERLDDYARMLGRELIQVPGTPSSLHDALSEACRRCAPVAVKWSITQCTNEDLPFGELRIIVEQPAFPRRSA